MFLLSGQLIQQLFDCPLCLAKALSSELSLRAVHSLCELWICRLYRLSSSPGRVERLLTPHSHPSIPLPPFPSVLFTLCSTVAVPPRRHSRPPRSWQPPQIGRWKPSPWKQQEVLQLVRTGADDGLVVGIFYAVDKAGEWRYDYMWLGP